MAPEYPTIRRKDRAKDDQWIKQHISAAPYLSMALIRDGRPHINTNTFVYQPESHAIYFHTAPNRTLRTMVESTPDCPISATTAVMGRLLPAPTAKEFSVEFASVVLFGRISVVDDLEECRTGMDALNRKYFPHLEPERDYVPASDRELLQITVYRIDIDHWTGKQKTAEPDHEGAFFYGNPPATE